VNVPRRHDVNTPFTTEVLVIGGGPAGTATAIMLAAAGIEVVLVEQQEFPRQKVCGECLSAGALAILDDLGIGEGIRAIAGPELRHVGWMGASKTTIAPFPRCAVGAHAYGRAIGRDSLDSLLLARARSLGVSVVQPAKVRRVAGTPGHFLCEVETRDGSGTHQNGRRLGTQFCTAQVVIDAHGSWEQAPAIQEEGGRGGPAPRRDSDLFAFKATFAQSRLPPGLLPVIVFPGGYGGIVVADDGRTTLACCIRRDTLRASRASMRGQPAGVAVEATLRTSCPGVAEALAGAVQEIAWLSVGPIRPGVRVEGCRDIFRVGNAAGETHPLIGEGIHMALHSARLAAGQLCRLGPARIDASRLHAANRAYAIEWRAAFGSRLRYATWYAHMAMRPPIADSLGRLLQARPSLITHAARWAGKARGATPARS
jgi:flavin-dependent dehydrogenase